MPTGKVKWYDADKGFGFLSQEDGPDVYVRGEALPDGVATLKAGTRVEFGIAQGRKGDQALQVRVLDAPASVSRNQSKAHRKKPEEMVAIVEDLIRSARRRGRGLPPGSPPGRPHRQADREAAARAGRRARAVGPAQAVCWSTRGARPGGLTSSTKADHSASTPKPMPRPS